MESRLEDIGRSFMDVEADFMKTGEIKARAKLAELRSEFDRKRDAARLRLAEAKRAGGSALEETQEGVMAAWNELTESMNRAKEELEKIKS